MPIRLEKYANVGTEEPWVLQFGVDLPALLNGTAFDEAQTESIRVGLKLILDELYAAHQALLQLRLYLDKSMNDAARSDIFTAFHHLYDHLLKAYSDRLTHLGHMCGFNKDKHGFALNFVVAKNDNQFELGISRFLNHNPALFGGMEISLRQDRINWSNRLKHVRDADQHKGERL